MPHATTLEDAAKVPAVTAGFWGLKILATTLGETGGDAVSMTLGLGYLVGTGIFAVVFAVLVAAQCRARGFHPALYWATIIASTTVGTTLADFVDRSLGIGYVGGSTLLLVAVLLSLAAWKRTLGTVSVASVRSTPAEAFYWLTIMLSQTLGTALGDGFADSGGLGYLGSAAVFAAALAAVALAWFRTTWSRPALFWAAFVLTRPLGAVVGDFLDKPLDHGGLALSRISASLVLLVLIAAGVHWLPQRAASADA
jgi:uncharacterized membrane-anchored protein